MCVAEWLFLERPTRAATLRPIEEGALCLAPPPGAAAANERDPSGRTPVSDMDPPSKVNESLLKPSCMPPCRPRPLVQAVSEKWVVVELSDWSLKSPSSGSDGTSVKGGGGGWMDDKKEGVDVMDGWMEGRRGGDE